MLASVAQCMSNPAAGSHVGIAAPLKDSAQDLEINRERWHGNKSSGNKKQFKERISLRTPTSFSSMLSGKDVAVHVREVICIDFISKL